MIPADAEARSRGSDIRARLLAGETLRAGEVRAAGAPISDLVPDDVRIVMESGGGTTLIRVDRETTIGGPQATVTEVVTGRRSGVEAFLEGRLRVRGNISLAMQMEGLVASKPRPKRWPRPATVNANGIQTFYLEAGSGPPVILLHGLGATNASMLTTLWDLAPDHRVLAPDLPGHGDTDKPIRAYHAAFFARWLGDFMDATGIREAVLVGNSLGGRVAMEMALRHPARVSRVVSLCGSPAHIRGRQYVPLVRLLRPEMAAVPLLLTHNQVVAAARLMFAVPDRLSKAWYDAFGDEFIRIFRTARGRIAFFSTARQIYLEEPVGRRGYWDRLPSLQVPALFVWGERDPLVPARFAAHVARALPNAESVVLPDCGHVPQYEFPERTHALIRKFLRRQVKRAA